MATLLTGLVSSLGTPWGLFRHYWVVAKLVLTLIAAVVLWVKTPLIDRLAAAALSGAAAGAATQPRMELVVHAAGGMTVLFAAMVLGIYKPRGVLSDGVLPRWVKVSALVVLTLGALAAFGAHLAAGHTRHLVSPG